MNQKPKFMKPLNEGHHHDPQVKEPMQKYNFFHFHKKNREKNILFCNFVPWKGNWINNSHSI